MKNWTHELYAKIEKDRLTMTLNEVIAANNLGINSNTLKGRMQRYKETGVLYTEKKAYDFSVIPGIIKLGGGPKEIRKEIGCSRSVASEEYRKALEKMATQQDDAKRLIMGNWKNNANKVSLRIAHTSS